MKRIFSIIMAAALVAGGLRAQTKRPDLKDFKTLEAYTEAVVDWKLDQRQPALRPATATEIFNLRTQCKAMVDKNWVITGQAFPKASVISWAHYVPRTNRCYASLNVSYSMESTTWSVEDVQTGERLAWAMEAYDKEPWRKSGDSPGQDHSKINGNDAFMSAMEYMTNLTKEER
jgi:hypothetical protein